MNGENASKKPQALASCRNVHNKSRAPVLMSCFDMGKVIRGLSEILTIIL